MQHRSSPIRDNSLSIDTASYVVSVETEEVVLKHVKRLYHWDSNPTVDYNLVHPLVFALGPRFAYLSSQPRLS